MLQKKTLKQTEVSTDIDIKEILGDLSKNESVREVFFQMALDKMQERLDSGRGVDGKLATYSKEYKESDSFKIFGKTSTVNMQLTGDMLAAVKELESSSGKIKIGIDDSLEAAKAYGHITGMKGHPTLAGKVPERNWFGWTDKELKQIAKEIKPEFKSKDEISDAAALNILDRLLNG
jgi:hypothetical protein